MPKLEYYDWISAHEKSLKSVECNPCPSCGEAMVWHNHDVKCPLCHIGTIGFSYESTSVNAWNIMTNGLNLRTKKTWYTLTNEETNVAMVVDFKYEELRKSPDKWNPAFERLFMIVVAIVVLFAFAFALAWTFGLDVEKQVYLSSAGMSLFMLWLLIRLLQYADEN